MNIKCLLLKRDHLIFEDHTNKHTGSPTLLNISAAFHVVIVHSYPANPTSIIADDTKRIMIAST